MKKSFISVLIVIGLLAACSTSSNSVPTSSAAPKHETAAERALRESNGRLQATVVEGTMIGTATGALFGSLTSGRKGAIRGAGIGFLGGTAAGIYVRNMQAKYVSEEAVLDQVLQDISRTNAELAVNIRAMRALVAERKRAVANATDDTAKAEIARSAKDMREMQQAVSYASQRAEFFGSARGILREQGTSTGALDPQIAKLKQRIAEMRAIAQELA